ncbi:MAG: LysR substrate-binding domain-containing protein, partial [Rhodospirillaceae bacterium]
ISIVVRSDGFDAMFDRLERGDVDIIVGAVGRGEQRERLVEEVLFQNPLSVIVRASHPLTRRAGLDFSDLADQDWILTRGSTAIRELIANEFRFEGMDLPSFAVETDDVLCIRSLLMSGDFVCANPAELFATEIARGVLKVLPIRWHGGTRPIGFTLREHGTITPAIAAFIDALREVGREIAGLPE